MLPLQTHKERIFEVEDKAHKGKLFEFIGWIPLAGLLKSEIESVKKINEIFQSLMDPKIVLDRWNVSREIVRWEYPVVLTTSVNIL